MTETAILFPGQGSHADGMDVPYRETPRFVRGLELLDYNPFERLDEGTRYQQPALFLCAVAAFDKSGIEDPIAAAGHSLGEYAALVAAEALEFDAAVELVDERAAAMADASRDQPGGMIALLGGERADVERLADELGLVVANDNAPGQLVLAGPLDAVDAAADRAREIGARSRKLSVSGAFHSPMTAPAAERLQAALDRVDFKPPRFPVYCNGTAAPFVDPARELAQNLLRGVRFRESLIAMRDAGARKFLELGPGRVLTGLVRRTLTAEAVA